RSGLLREQFRRRVRRKQKIPPQNRNRNRPNPRQLRAANSRSANVAQRSTSLPRWLNRFVWFTAFATLLLICSGGMVTSKGVGLAVPDWPTTFGYNMFLFPVSKWIGGIFFEHTHRLIASTGGFLTIILAVWLWRTENRQSVKTLGLITVAG